jgi:hypothetical protein
LWCAEGRIFADGNAEGIAVGAVATLCDERSITAWARLSMLLQ